MSERHFRLVFFDPVLLFALDAANLPAQNAKPPGAYSITHMNWLTVVGTPMKQTVNTYGDGAKVMNELIMPPNEKIYDPAEFDRAMAWVKAHCPEGKDWNPPAAQKSREKKDADWATSVKMAIIARDLMVGNPRLAELGYGEEALGRNAIAGGFQGQRQWTDHFPNGDFMEAILNSSFDWNGIREPFVFATENDSLNGATMLFGHFADD